ncbi:MAG: hypothetical protein JWR21_4448 [Herminiimonas sp.]|nr:hypothetical protein [Herminiimonas sp.]
MKPIQIPKVTDVSGRLAELEARRDKINSAVRTLDKDRMELAQAATQPEADEDPVDLRVARLLGEAPPKILKDHRGRLADMAQQSRDLHAALDLVLEQIRVEHSKAAAVVREKVSPEYRLRIRAICEAFRGVHAANLELRALTEALEAQGIEWSGLGVVAPRALGFPTDQYSPIAQYFRDAADLGFITRSEIPTELRQ